MLRVIRILLFIGLSFGCSACESGRTLSNEQPAKIESSSTTEVDSLQIKQIVENALEQTEITKNYSKEYFQISYPNGDLPIETGACTDVIIRAFRKAGVDLQKEVHEDMRSNFGEYPKKWGLERPDTNIDHRRVPNLQTFFTRKKRSISITDSPKDYRPGDIVSWDLGGKGVTHIGLVSNVWNRTGDRFLIVHNIGAGTRAEDVLFSWKITGHYRYF